MPEMDIRQPGFMYSACGPFTKTKERIKKKLRNRRFKRDLPKRKLVFNMNWLMDILKI